MEPKGSVPNHIRTQDTGFEDNLLNFSGIKQTQTQTYLPQVISVFKINQSRNWPFSKYQSIPIMA